MIFAKTIFFTIATLIVPLYLWRVIYLSFSSDWSVIFLLILALALFYSTFATSSEIYRRHINNAILPDSSYHGRFTGNWRATIKSLFFSVLTTLILAGYSLTITPPMILVFLGLCFVCVSLFLYFHHYLQSHLSSAYFLSVSRSIGIIVPLLIFLPLLTWLNWSLSPPPDRFGTALRFFGDLFNLTPHSDIYTSDTYVSQLLILFRFLETTKLLFHNMFFTYPWARVFLSLDSAFVAIIVSQSSVNLANFARVRIASRIHSLQNGTCVSREDSV